MAISLRCRGHGLYYRLVTQFLTVQVAVALSKSTAGDEEPPDLAINNGTVPEYITRYAPLVWLHSEDPFRPADLLEHIRHTTARTNHEPIPDLPELDLDNLALLNDFGGKKVSLTSNDDVSSLPTWLLGESPDESGKVHNATPCVVVLVEKGPVDIDAFFFYFYSYDRGPSITQVVEPLNGLIEDTEQGMHFGDHVGDWEHNMIRFQEGKPTGIYYSQHRDGTAYGWDDAALSMRNERPLVFSAYGSHANYASEGDHIHDKVLVDYCDAGQLWDPTLSAYFYQWNPTMSTLTRLLSSSTLTPANSNLTSFFHFTGRWGDAQYPDNHPLQKSVPYFGLKRFVSGPQGPIVKHLVRKGLYPDKRRVDSWLEWAVRAFMALYPCCFRGWRAWVSGVLALVLLVAIALLVSRGIKRYRMRGYKRIDTEIPLDSWDSSENTNFDRIEGDQH